MKMVHNGIEYGDMQLICEAYFLLKEALGLSNDELYDVFAEWNRGELDSYLIEITRDIFSVKDPETGDDLVDMILDTAGAKGTGKWMSQLALDLGVPSTLVTEAVYARSPVGAERGACAGQQSAARAASARYDRAIATQFIDAGAPSTVRLEDLQLRPRLRANCGGGQRAQLAARITATSPCCGAAAASSGLGFWIASKKPSTPTRNWKTCCWPRISPKPIDEAQAAWRHVVATAVELGIPVPAFTTALSYFDGFRREPTAGQSVASPARLFRRPHVPAHRPARHIPHRLDPAAPHAGLMARERASKRE